MKILCLGDFHLNNKQPVNRIDDYWHTAKKKLEWALVTAKRKGASVIIAPGDFTDSPSISYSAYSDILSILKENLNSKMTMLSIWGQHDMRYRTMENTALSAIEVAFANTPEFRSLEANEVCDMENVSFYGSSYGDEVPNPIEGHFNILIVHRMLIEEKLWNAQEEYEPSNTFLRQHPFDLIVSGDNHRPFLTQAGGSKRLLVNCGAMLRSNIDQVDHKPFVVLFDTETKEHEKIYIPIEDGEKVFKIGEVELAKERNANLETFISGLSNNKSIDLTFEDNLKRFIKENNIGEEISQIIIDAMKKEKP